MSQRFNNKYRILSARLQNWNYANEAMYFVTICTKNRENYFGEIVNSSLEPTEIGKIAHLEWYKTIELRHDMNLALGEFVVMPNHVHAIIMIGANEYNHSGRDAMHCVSTNPNALNVHNNPTAVSTFARKNGFEFGWQTRFYDHIIRSMDEFTRISNYIIKNPAKWQKDTFK